MPISSPVRTGQPKTIDATVDGLVTTLPLKCKTTIANMKEKELPLFYQSLGKDIIEKFGIFSDNEDTIDSDRFGSKKYDIPHKIHDADASALVLRELLETLRESHTLRVVK